ncbi:MAG: hypothetical protein H6579_09660 [Chitinophagales bacterium]|nr:hypothetical protein [Chitinophagales bacterium]
MKTLIFTLVISLVFTFSQAQSYDSPVEYMSFFNNEYNIISKETWDYTSAIARGKKARKIETQRNELLLAIKQAEIKIGKVKDYEGDIALRDKVLEYLSLSYVVLKEDYDKILDMEEIAEQSYDLMEAYMLAKDEAGKKLEQAHNLVSEEQKRFAKEHNVTLTEASSELEEKLLAADEVFNYYNQLYLVFFKSFKNDAYLSDAMAKLDLLAIEQNLENAKTIAEEGTGKLKEFGAFNSDNSLKDACQKLLDFYTKDAKENLSSKLILLQEKYEAKNKIMQSKKKSEITQQDVDDFNSVVNELNATSNQYNEYNQASYKEKSALIENWNKAVQSFLDRHTPK